MVSPMPAKSRCAATCAAIAGAHGVGMSGGCQSADAFAHGLGDNDDMNIQLNGQPRTLSASATIHDLLQAEQLLERRVAVEVNGEIVTRSLHASHVLAEGDVVEIVHALGGG